MPALEVTGRPAIAQNVGARSTRPTGRVTVDAAGPSGLFFLGSAHLSNEENFLLRKIADHLACPNRDVVVDSRPVGLSAMKKPPFCAASR